MTSAVEIIAEWLNEKGFNEAAIQLLQASGEVEERVDRIAELDWLDYQDELKKAHALLDPSRDEDDPLPF